jgi:hypothetical protein
MSLGRFLFLAAFVIIAITMFGTKQEQSSTSKPTAEHSSARRLKANTMSGTIVILFRSSDAMDRHYRLTHSGVFDESLLLPLEACRVKPGTAVIETSGGFFSSDVLVTEGPNKGCEGIVSNETLESPGQYPIWRRDENGQWYRDEGPGR